MADAMEAAATEAASEPVVSATATQGERGRMSDAIDSLTGGVPLGETDVGKAWCLKALHPADTSILSSPMPTYETRSMASVAFNQLDLITLPATGDWDPTKTWNCKIWLHRDPVLLFSYSIEQPGIYGIRRYVFSKQIGEATTYAQAYQALRTNCEKFRMTSQSITCYFDAASQSDQGHIICAQTELPRVTAPYWPSTAPTNDTAIQMQVAFYQDPPPTYEQLLQTSRAYQGKAADGVYAPSKLLNIGQWVYTNQSYKMIGTAPTTTVPGPGVVPFKSYAQTTFEGDEPAANFGVYTFPFTNTEMVFGQPDTSLTTIMINGIAQSSSLRITTRWTLDVVVRPGTIYAPFAKMPPQADYNSLRMYSEVSRRMPDGHPSSFNNLGAILGVIGKVAATVAPTLISKLGSWVGDRVNIARRAGKRSALELINQLNGREYDRLEELMKKEVAGTLSEPERFEMGVLVEKAKTPAVGLTDVLTQVPGALMRSARSEEAPVVVAAPRTYRRTYRRYAPRAFVRRGYYRSYGNRYYGRRSVGGYKRRRSWARY